MLHRALQIETLKSVHKNGVQYRINNKILRALGVKIPSFIVREDVVE
jgi:hypothetical protein